MCACLLHGLRPWTSDTFQPFSVLARGPPMLEGSTVAVDLAIARLCPATSLTAFRPCSRSKKDQHGVFSGEGQGKTR